MSLPIRFEEMVFSLQVHGYFPILAHPERILPIMHDPRILEPLVHRGLLLQVTAGSLLGKNGNDVEDVAYSLLDHRWVHFVASDAHSPIHRRPELDSAAKELVDIVGPDAVTVLFEENGRRILEDQSVATNPLPFTVEKKKRWFNFFSSR
jgi:protein-tyrosine phosphatase